MLESLSKKFPPLYECSKCGAAVKVTPLGLGVEPKKEWSCGHDGEIIYANRKVICRGKGNLNYIQESCFKIKLTVRQILSNITGRSI